MLPTLVLLTITAFGLGSGSSPSGCDTSDPSFDYLLLVAQWPAAQGSASWPAGADITDFTLHGLWPSRIGAAVNSYPCTCTDEQFDESKVGSVLSEMKAHWPSYTGQDDQFWGHEWSKHGTCCNTTQGLKDQASFFGAALSFLNKAGLQDALKTGGVTPGASYAYNNMSDAIKAAVGVAPLMGCKTGNTLSEVGMCIDKASMKFTECDVSVKTQKGDEVSDCDQTQQVSFVSSTGPSPTPPSPSAGTCKAYGCGKFLAGKPCQCNNQCAQFDDCCPDYQSTCGSTPTPPTPPSDKCVSGELGPACSADSDCTSISNCIRCASSGHCTCVDKGTGRCAGGLVQAL